MVDARSAYRTPAAASVATDTPPTIHGHADPCSGGRGGRASKALATFGSATLGGAGLAAKTTSTTAWPLDDTLTLEAKSARSGAVARISCTPGSTGISVSHRDRLSTTP